MPPKRAVRRRRPFVGRSNVPIKKILKDKLRSDLAGVIDSYIPKSAWQNLTISFEELKAGVRGSFNEPLLKHWWYLLNNGAPEWFCRQVFWEFGYIEESLTNHGWPQLQFRPSTGMTAMVLQVVRNAVAASFPDLGPRALQNRKNRAVWQVLGYCTYTYVRDVIHQEIVNGVTRVIPFGLKRTWGGPYKRISGSMRVMRTLR